VLDSSSHNAFYLPPQKPTVSTRKIRSTLWASDLGKMRQDCKFCHALWINGVYKLQIIHRSPNLLMTHMIKARMHIYADSL